MKKIKYLILSFSLILSGCFLTEKDITKMIFPVAMMIGGENNMYQVYLLSVSTTSNSKIELETSTDISKYSVSKFEANSISEAISKAGIATKGTTSAMKIETIILHDSLFSNYNLDYQSITAHIINNPLFRTNSYIYYSKYKADELLNISSIEVSDSYYYYIIRPEKENLKDYILPSRLIDTSKAYIDNKRMFYLPSLSIKTSDVKQEKDGELVDVNTYYVDGAYFLNKAGNFSYVDISKLNGFKWADKKEYFDIEIGSDIDPIYLKIETVKWDIEISDSLNLNIKLKTKINYNHSSLTIKEIESKLKETIKKDIYETYTSLYKDIDIYLFNDLAYRLNKNIDNISSFNLNIDLMLKNTIYQY